MKVSGIKINLKVKEHINGNIKKENMKDFGKIIRCLARENCSGVMEQSMMEIGSMKNINIYHNPIKLKEMIRT